MGKNRPHWCFGDCEPIFSRYSRENFDKGASCFCYGQMTTEHIFTAKATEHINDLSHCLYTPLKGIIRFFLNENDAYVEFLSICAVLDTISPHICKSCGAVPWRGGPLHANERGEEFCGRCHYQGEFGGARA